LPDGESDTETSTSAMAARKSSMRESEVFDFFGKFAQDFENAIEG
jgi:hypothetical protein